MCGFAVALLFVCGVALFLVRAIGWLSLLFLVRPNIAKGLEEEGRTKVYVANAKGLEEEGRTEVYVASGEQRERLEKARLERRLEKARLEERRYLKSIKSERLENERHDKR